MKNKWILGVAAVALRMCCRRLRHCLSAPSMRTGSKRKQDTGIVPAMVMDKRIHCSRHPVRSAEEMRPV